MAQHLNRLKFPDRERLAALIRLRNETHQDTIEEAEAYYSEQLGKLVTAKNIKSIVRECNIEHTFKRPPYVPSVRAPRAAPAVVQDPLILAAIQAQLNRIEVALTALTDAVNERRAARGVQPINCSTTVPSATKQPGAH